MAAETGHVVGIKPAGGIRASKQEVQYLVTLYETLGQQWMTPDLFRFGASSLLFPHWAWLLWLLPFLLLHELGHWSAMRLFGHRDARIRFIPFLGAATLTTSFLLAALYFVSPSLMIGASFW